MKILNFNDGRNLEVQQIIASNGVLHARMILQTSEQLKAFFMDEFATAKMVEIENGKEIAVYENYTKLSYVKEEVGGIWEVELRQPEADVQTRMVKVEELTASNTETLEQAIAELTIMLASFILPENNGMTEEVEENV